MTTNANTATITDTTLFTIALDKTARLQKSSKVMLIVAVATLAVLLTVVAFNLVQSVGGLVLMALEAHGIVEAITLVFGIGAYSATGLASAYFFRSEKHKILFGLFTIIFSLIAIWSQEFAALGFLGYIVTPVMLACILHRWLMSLIRAMKN